MRKTTTSPPTTEQPVVTTTGAQDTGPGNAGTTVENELGKTVTAVNGALDKNENDSKLDTEGYELLKNGNVKEFNALQERNGKWKPNFKSKDFANCDLTGVKFDYANLSGARFSKKALTDASFDDCDLTECQFVGMDMSETSFFQCNLTKSKFINVNLSNVKTSHTNLHESVFYKCIFDEYISFKFSNLSFADFVRCDFGNDCFPCLEFYEVDLTGIAEWQCIIDDDVIEYLSRHGHFTSITISEQDKAVFDEIHEKQRGSVGVESYDARRKRISDIDSGEAQYRSCR